MATLTLRTVTQAALFEKELKGQISDGHWGNTRPLDHWKVWCNIDVVVGENVGRDFWARKDNYNFTDKALLECVGGRMLVIARLAHAGIPMEDIDALESLFTCDTGAWEGKRDWMDRIETYKKVHTKYNLDTIRETIEKSVVDMAWVIRDLKEIKKAIRIQK